MSDQQLWFRSTLFEIEPDEDSETNPFCYGKQLSHWLRDRLTAKGRSVEPVIPEDWGWCVMVQRKPCMLWVGCSNVHDYGSTTPGAPPPSAKEVVWSCMVVAEQPLLSRLFRPVDVAPQVQELFAEVRSIIEAEPRNVLCEEP